MVTPDPIGILNGQGGELLIELIQNQGGIKAFPKDGNKTLLESLERLAEDGYLEMLRETPDTLIYTLIV